VICIVLYTLILLTDCRIKRVKMQRSFDPEVVKSVEAKLQNLKMQDERHSQPVGEESTS
jgi:hypothetical protein